MELKYLSHLRCPAAGESGRCLFPLVLDEGEVPPSFFPRTAEDLAEGALRCDACRARFPVLCGVAILAYPLQDFIRANYGLLLGYSSEMGAPPTRMIPFLRRLAAGQEGRGEAEVKPPPFRLYDRQSSNRAAKFLSSYLINHYLGLERLPVLSEAQRRLVAGSAEAGNPHSVLLGMLERAAGAGGRTPPGAELALDVGCSVGGLTSLLAGHARAVLGVDTSFECMASARALLKGLPMRRTSIPVFTEGDNRIECPVEPKDGKRCEFLVATGDRLPFAPASFRLAASANLVDVVEKPQRLLEEFSRILEEDGLLLLSTPFLSTSSGVTHYLGKEGIQPVVELKDRLARVGLQTLEERDDVPWVVYHYRRRLDFYLTYCLAARRSGSEPIRPAPVA